MPSELSSIFIGTSGLTVAAVVSLQLAVSRRGISAVDLPRVRRLAALGVGLQACHFAEEYGTHFYARFPELLGLAPWSAAFFTSFNLGWLLIWIASVALLGSHPRVALFPIWFLGIASAANGVAHPVLSLVSGGYFPGLWTSPLVGALGVILLRSLASATK